MNGYPEVDPPLCPWCRYPKFYHSGEPEKEVVGEDLYVKCTIVTTGTLAGVNVGIKLTPCE